MGRRFNSGEHFVEDDALWCGYTEVIMRDFLNISGASWDEMIDWCNSEDAPGVWEVEVDLTTEGRQNNYWQFSDPNTAFEFKMRFL